MVGVGRTRAGEASEVNAEVEAAPFPIVARARACSSWWTLSSSACWWFFLASRDR